MSDFILVKNLHKSYKTPTGKFKVLDGINLSLKEGTFYTIFGPNGSGKTTFLRVIAGLTPYDMGTVSINGKGVGQAEIGYIFQDFRDSLLPWRKSIDDIAFPLEIKGIKKSSRYDLVHEKLKDLNLSLPLDRYTYQLSIGQQQIVAIVRALVQDPDLLIFDEPFSSLDYYTRLSMEDNLLNIWKKDKKTFVFVSHDIDESIYLSDSIIIFSQLPVQILTTIENNIVHPRTFEIRKSPEFFKLRNFILDSMRKL